MGLDECWMKDLFVGWSFGGGRREMKDVWLLGLICAREKGKGRSGYYAVGRGDSWLEQPPVDLVSSWPTTKTMTTRGERV